MQRVNTLFVETSGSVCMFACVDDLWSNAIPKGCKFTYLLELEFEERQDMEDEMFLSGEL